MATELPPHEQVRHQQLGLNSALYLPLLRGDDEYGQTYAINDPMASRLQELSRQHGTDTAATTAALLGLPEIWGDALVADGIWQQRVAHWLADINRSGVRAAMAHLHKADTA